MNTTLYVPSFVADLVLPVLTASNHTLDDVFDVSNRPDDVCCVERMFGALIPADQLITVYSGAAYNALGMPTCPAPVYFQITAESKGILCVDVDQLANITERDVAMVMWLCAQVDSGVLKMQTTNLFDAIFEYNGVALKYLDIIHQVMAIFEANLDMAEDMSCVTALGMYIQPWYRDAANAVADKYGMDPRLEQAQQLLKTVA